MNKRDALLIGCGMGLGILVAYLVGIVTLVVYGGI